MKMHNRSTKNFWNGLLGTVAVAFPLVGRPSIAVTVRSKNDGRKRGLSRPERRTHRYDFTTLVPLVVVGAMALAGCIDRNAFAPKPIFDNDTAFNIINICNLIDPKYSSNECVTDKATQTAYRNFYDPDKYPVTTRTLRRNRVQDRIIQVSNQRCGRFKNRLKKYQAQVNLAFGALSTLAGAAGAIVAGPLAANILAGTAGAASGIRAEWNEDFFAKQTVSVITKGISSRRNDMLNNIQRKRGQPFDTPTANSEFTAANENLANAKIEMARATKRVATLNGRANDKGSIEAIRATLKTGNKNPKEKSDIEAQIKIMQSELADAKEVVAIHEDCTTNRPANCGRIKTLTKIVEGKKNIVEAVNLPGGQAAGTLGAVNLTPAPVTLYTVEIAVADAVRYHTACSLIAGLEELSDKIKQADDPGIDAMTKNLKKIRLLNIEIKKASKAAKK